MPDTAVAGACPVGHAPYRLFQSAAYTDIPGIHVGGATGQQDHRGQGGERLLSDQHAEYLCRGAVATVDGHDLHAQLCKILQCLRDILLSLSDAMVDAGMICDNGLYRRKLAAVTPAVWVRDQADPDRMSG